MSDSGDRPQRREWLENRGALWAASSAVILLVLAGLAAVLLWGHDGRAAQPAAPTPPVYTPTPTPDGTPTPPTAASSCNPPATDQTVPTTPPRGVQWSVVNTVALPWSPTTGPIRRHGALWTCYAHTPTGALMAAAVLSVTPDSPQGAEVLQKQALPGPNRAAQLTSLRQQPPQPKQPGETAVIAGYRFLDYSPQRAAIQIVGAYGGRYFVVTVPLAWASGDWKLNLDPPGGPVPGQAVSSLAGYRQWGAK